jgi:hypothetical protein
MVLAADDNYDEIPISFLFLSSFDVDERRIRDLQQAQRVNQEHQQVLKHGQVQIDGVFHCLHELQQTVNGCITKIKACAWPTN